jgi:AraC-like DNA-binding protein
MPLYMDYHKFESISVESVKVAHTADESVQDEYGVKYLQFWVNEGEGSVFCLVEGPDKETCEKVHQIAHGNLACALTEVETVLYEKLMGKDIKVNHGHVQRADGSQDLGYRNILVASVYSITPAKSSKDLSLLLTPYWARNIIAEKISEFNGRDIKWEADDCLIGIFDDSTLAVQCALQIQKALIQNVKQEVPEIIFKIGISASQPVTKDGDFFTEAIKMAHRLSTTVQDNLVLTSSLVKKLCKDEKLLTNENLIRSLSASEEEFISKLLGVAEANLSEQDFDLDNLSSEICISRPQLYRKVKALTGRSPNDFVHDLRMNKALALLKQKKANITEIAFETGFGSPSYFTKCFTQKFGCAPSLFAKTNAD